MDNLKNGNDLVKTIGSEATLESLQQAVNIAKGLQSSVTFTPEAQKISGVMEDHVETIFSHALDRIMRVRQACDSAEQALKNRRSAAKDAVNAFILCVQEVEKQSDKMQQTVGDIMVATARLGG